MMYIKNDGGRAAAGFKGYAGDCVTRALAIAMELDYKYVYDEMAKGNVSQRRGKYEKKSKAGKRTARDGINVRRKWFKDWMKSHGWEWIACSGIGIGCKVHLKKEELPMGRIICSLSRHYTAVIDGTPHDLYDASREGTRCVYGYWRKAQ
jgi:hypothetical protein